MWGHCESHASTNSRLLDHRHGCAGECGRDRARGSASSPVLSLITAGAGATGLSFTRPVTVLDLATDSVGAWATRAGGTYAISTGQHAVTQSWARSIVEAFPDLDGLRYNSRFAGAPCLALFAPASTAMPARPMLSLPLTHPDFSSRIAGAAKRLGYAVV